jgi:hypothetical protein
MALSNAERQARWRANRAAELKQLRKAAGEPLVKAKPLSPAERQARWRANQKAELERLRRKAKRKSS